MLSKLYGSGQASPKPDLANRPRGAPGERLQTPVAAVTERVVAPIASSPTPDVAALAIVTALRK